MTNIQIKYPILLIRKNDKFLYGFSSNIGIVSKGGNSFYTKEKISMYDSTGNYFELKKANLNGKANWLVSLRYFQQVYEMNLEFEKKAEIPLNVFKSIIIDHMTKYQKHWLSLDTLEGLKEMVNREKNFSEIIRKLK